MDAGAASFRFNFQLADEAPPSDNERVEAPLPLPRAADDDGETAQGREVFPSLTVRLGAALLSLRR